MSRPRFAAVVLIFVALAGCSDPETTPPDPSGQPTTGASATIDTGTTTQQLGVSEAIPCPDSQPRRAIEGGPAPGGDGLPPVDSAGATRTGAEQVLADTRDELTTLYDPVDIYIGIGPGWAWAGPGRGEPFAVVPVDNFSIVILLANADACPTPPELWTFWNGVELRFESVP